MTTLEDSSDHHFMSHSSRNGVLIFRTHLLGRSETFIAAQAQALSRFRPHFLGLRKVAGLELPAEACIVGDRSPFGRLAEAAFVLTGRSMVAEQCVRSWRPHLVHAHFGPDGAAIASFARTRDLPLVVTFHGYDATYFDAAAQRSFRLHRYYIRKREELKRQTALFIAVSDFIRDCLLAQGFPPERVVTHYTGIDLSQFAGEARPRRKNSVLFVGRLVPKKGCEYLIRAMAGVQANVPDAELLIVGDGPLRSQLEQLASSSRVRCQFLGQQTSAAVRTLLSEAAVFSVPSVRAESGDAEGFGMVFAEAQAMGVPVATFASGGIPEAVADGVTGLLAPERDTLGLQHNILALLTDRPLWSRMSSAGQQRVTNLFDIRKQTAKLEALYDHVLETHNYSGSHQQFSSSTQHQAGGA